jgi:hypothetical protein
MLRPSRDFGKREKCRCDAAMRCENYLPATDAGALAASDGRAADRAVIAEIDAGAVVDRDVDAAAVDIDSGTDDVERVVVGVGEALA